MRKSLDEILLRNKRNAAAGRKGSGVRDILSKDLDTENITRYLAGILSYVRNLAQMHGVPDKTKINWATPEALKHAEGAATWEKRASSLIPRILLSSGAFEEFKHDDKLVLEIYCGITLHECGHLNHTQAIVPNTAEYRLYSELGKTKFGEFFYNLLEDTRIEEKTIEESPGYAQYIWRIREYILSRKSRKEFKDLSDKDKFFMLVFNFLRTPEEITDEMKTWVTPNGFHVFDDLEKIIEYLPETEIECLEKAKQLNDWLMNILEDAAESSDDPSLLDDLSKKPERAEKETDTPKIPPKFKDMGEPLDFDSSPASSEPIPEPTPESIPELIPESSGDDAKESSSGESVSKEVLREFVKEFADDTKGEVKKEIESFGKDSKGLDIVTEKEIEALLEQESTEIIAEDGSEGRRRKLVVFPTRTPSGDRLYALAHNKVVGHVAKLRRIFSFREAERKYRYSELTEGKLNRRLLSSAGAGSDRLFYKEEIKKSSGLSMCLLLDGSGSMYGTRIEVARSIAVLFAEALAGQKGIELEIYSYSAPTHDSMHSEVRYLYGKMQSNKKVIGTYTNTSENYDHLSLQSAHKLFVANTTNKNRLMLVVSDGAPQGCGYGGDTAIRQTRDAIKKISRDCAIMGIAIESYKIEKMYDHYVKWTNLDDLINQMSKKLVQVIRQSYRF